MMSDDVVKFAKFGALALFACASAGILALTLAGWQRYGADIFLSAIESGLAWCL